MLNNIKKSSQKVQQLVKQVQKQFSIYTNQGHPVKEIISGKEIVYDHNITQYEPMIQAFITKRKTKKSEIPAKIQIIEPLQSIENELQQQQLQPLKQLYNLEQQLKIHEHNAYNTQYITSITCEPFFKKMMDQYLDKVLISGRTVSLEEYNKQTQIENKAKKLYKKFFFGDELTELEKEIEFRFLALKQQKFFKYQQTEKNRYKCQWTYSQQRRVELMKNWRSRDINLYDDIRPIYEPLNILEKQGNQELMIKLNQEGFQRQFMFNLFESRFFNPKSKKFYHFITQYLQTRTMLYLNSIEFNRVLQIPPDFHIEHSILNVHMWMIQDRLTKINTKQAGFIKKDIDYNFKKYTLDRIGKIHLKKKDDFIKDVNHFMVNNRNAFDRHFNALYRNDPYEKIDSLVWSTIFFEKVDRYSEEVYLMSEYLIQNYYYIQQLEYEDIQNCNISWDVFRISLDYKEKILLRNPQLTQEEYQKELESDNKNKKYYYSYELPLQKEEQKPDVQGQGVKDKAALGIFKTIRKYQNLETYDHYSQKEEEKKKLQKQSEQSPWETEETQDKVQYSDKKYFDQIKKQRRQQQSKSKPDSNQEK